MYVGIDVGGTSIKYGLIDSKGNIVAKDTLVTSFEKEELLQNLADIVEKYVSSSPETIEGVGISMPGIVQEDGFLLTAGAIRSCYGINLKEEMEKRTGILTKEVIDSNGANLDWENK
ncbi:ROK family protein [Enterococcus faecium]|uniref:ROK family protein n=1 Tax=Enterococcus faecium TaxID=1352 RepID=UPI00349F9B48